MPFLCLSTALSLHLSLPALTTHLLPPKLLPFTRPIIRNCPIIETILTIRLCVPTTFLISTLTRACLRPVVQLRPRQCETQIALSDHPYAGDPLANAVADLDALVPLAPGAALAYGEDGVGEK
jgi:hypothetical protein